MPRLAKMKACPFCGSSGEELMIFCDPDEGRDNSGPSRRVQCAGCNIEAPFYSTEAEAISAWNRRAPSRADQSAQSLREERDTLQIRARNYASISTEWRKRAEAAEAENARSRALPLKDEVEGVLEPLDSVHVTEDGWCKWTEVANAIDEAHRRLSRLRAGEREGWRAECATEGCAKPATVHFERGEVGSYYCHDCYMRIQALPAAPSEQGGDRD